MKFWPLLLTLFFTPLAVWGMEEIPRELDFDRRLSEPVWLEISPHFGDYFGDKLHHSFETGLNLQANLIPEFGVETDFNYSSIRYDRASPLGQTITDENLYLMSGGLVATRPGAYQSRHRVVEIDLSSSLGGGAVRFNRDYRGMGYLTLGMKMKFVKISWLGWNLMTRYLIYSIPNPGGSDLEWDLALTIGPSFLLFPH